MKRIFFLMILSLVVMGLSAQYTPVSGDTESFVNKRVIWNANDSLNNANINAIDNRISNTAEVPVIEMSGVAALYADTVSPTGKLISRQQVKDLIAADTSGGGSGGGSSVTAVEFTIGVTENAPTNGDTVLANDAFAGSHVKLLVDGVQAKRAVDRNSTGYFHSQDSLYLHPSFATNSWYYIEVTDSTTWSPLTLRDTSVSTLADAIGSWSFEETAGTIANDATGNNNLNITNATINQTGRIGKAYTYNGTNAYLGGTKLHELQTFSVSAWVNTSTNNYYGIVGNRHFTGDGWEMITTDDFPDNGHVQFMVNNTPNVNLISTTAIADGGWHHIVITFTSGQQQLWVDGVLEGSDTWAGTITYDVSGNFRIGSSRNALYMNGSIDAVGIWNRVLTNGEIAELYNSGTGIQYPY